MRLITFHPGESPGLHWGVCAALSVFLLIIHPLLGVVRRAGCAWGWRVILNMLARFYGLCICCKLPDTVLTITERGGEYESQGVMWSSEELSISSGLHIRGQSDGAGDTWSLIFQPHPLSLSMGERIKYFETTELVKKDILALLRFVSSELGWGM